MVRIVGQRGGRHVCAENSLPGFREVRELAVDAVGVDVHLTRAGELLVIHDPTLDRTTAGAGQVADVTRYRLADRFARRYPAGIDAGNVLVECFNPADGCIEFVPSLPRICRRTAHRRRQVAARLPELGNSHEPYHP